MLHETGAALATDMGEVLEMLKATLELRYQAGLKQAADPEGGQWPGSPSGKSLYAACGPTGAGKKFYPNVKEGLVFKSEPYNGACTTPVIHYCPGGLEIDADSAVLQKDGTSISGLFVAGVVAGGEHGNNIHGGNSLLDCAVFGWVSGRRGAK